MSLTDAWKVAVAVSSCWDPPVVHGIFGNLSEAFPHLRFHVVDFDTIRVEDVSKGLTIFIEGDWNGKAKEAPAPAVD